MNAEAKEKEEGEEELVMFAGRLTVDHVAEIKNDLLKTLNNAKKPGIIFGQIIDVDLSYLQLLCSAHRTAVKLHKHLSLKGDVPQILKTTAEAAGFTRLKACRIDCRESCLWAATGVHHG